MFGMFCQKSHFSGYGWKSCENRIGWAWDWSGERIRVAGVIGWQIGKSNEAWLQFAVDVSAMADAEQLYDHAPVVYDA